MANKVFVLGIDGFPFSLLRTKIARNEITSLRSIFEKGHFRRMNSVYPTISSVAWSTYATGVNPGSHSIFGFIDRTPDPFSLFIPLSTHKKAENIWKYLNSLGKKVIIINVPLTYPPERVDGIMISGFLCPDINKLCYPEKYNAYLEEKDYVIDVDAWLARKDKRQYLNSLVSALEKRFETAFALMREEEWDFFQLHIMETDRLMHFFWSEIENKGEFRREVEYFIQTLDRYIAALMEKLNDEVKLLILSDHGFCGVEKEVQLNVWLERENLLKLDSRLERKIQNYTRESVCYSLIPGRIYINLEGREENGTVKEHEYENTRRLIKSKLQELRDPATGKTIIDKVFYREDIYRGEYLEQAPDIIAHPVNGYDLKGNLDGEEIFATTSLNGMHSYDDAFICSSDVDVSSVQSIEDVKSVIETLFT